MPPITLDELASQPQVGVKPQAPAQPGFFEQTLKPYKDFNTALAMHPLETINETAKGLIYGAADLAESIPTGLLELGAAINGLVTPDKGLSRSDSMGKNVEHAKQASQYIKDSVNKLANKIGLVNVAPPHKVDEAVGNLLAVIPNGIQAAGDTVYEKTGSALAGAGSSAILTLLTLDAGVGAKVFRGAADVIKGKNISAGSKIAAEKIQTSFEHTAAVNPEGAQELADHIKKVDPEVGQHLEDTIEKVKEATPQEEILMGKNAAKASMNEKTVKLYRGVSEGRDPTSTHDTVGGAHFYSPLDSVAEKFAGEGGTVVEKDIGFKNLLEARDYNGIKKALKLDKKASTTEVIEEAKRQGYDGMKFSSLNGVEYAHFPGVGDVLKKTVDTVPPEVIGAGLRETMKDGYASLAMEAKPPAGMKSPVMYMENNQPVTRASVDKAFRMGASALDTVPGMNVVKGKLAGYYEESIRLVNPEALGPDAKLGAAVLAKNIATQMQKDSSFFHQAETRRNFWNHRVEESQDFINKFEKGEKFSDPTMQAAADSYRQWNKDIYEVEAKAGIEYDPVDNYLYHTFEDSKGVATFMQKRFGPNWNKPGFMKDRSFDMYQQAIKAGFKPKYSNPEDIMLARQHASDVALMRVQTLKDLETYGLARKVAKGEEGHPEGIPTTQWRSPNGDRYWVNNDASAVMHNFFETKGLWDAKGFVGDTFKGAMFLKNTIVPIRLGLSLFHPLHVATIDNATAMVRSSKELLAGTKNPAQWMKDMSEAALYKDFISNPKMGSKVLNAYRGKVKESELTSADKQSLQYMAEGGLIPEMSAQFKTNSIENFKKAIQNRSATAVFHAPFAALNAIQKPMFEQWIPSLKVASYLKDVQTALKVDPTLVSDPARRLVAFRKIAKSVDNRYGEMAYNTLFMNRMVKDVAVADTLSLGWQMGFLREYGGGAMDIGQALTKEGSVATKAKAGMLDRPLFVSFYTAQALVYGGLLTWAMTGKSPQSLLDYIYPQNGETDSKGNPQRVTTMFYTREFASIAKHVQTEGLGKGMSDLVASKSSGLIGLTSEWASGVNSYGQEIRDPSSPAYKQLAQTLSYTLSDLEPISLQAINKGSGGVKNAALAVAGFSPAPQYVTEPQTEALIKNTYSKYYGAKQTPYEKAQFSDDGKKLKQYYQQGDMDKYSDLLDKMEDKYDLTAKDKLQLYRSAMGGKEPAVTMFERLTWQQQKKILDQMSDEEREQYLPHANKEHLRYKYEAP